MSLTKELRMPVHPLKIASLLLEGGQRDAFRLVDEVFPAAFKASAQEIERIDGIFRFLQYEFNASVLFSSFHSLREFGRMNKLGNITFGTVNFRVDGRDKMDIKEFNVSPNPEQFHEIDFIGCYGDQPFVKISANNRSDSLTIDFRGLDNFVSTD